MATVAFEVSPVVAQAYLRLAPHEKRQFEFDCVFRLGQMRKPEAATPPERSVELIASLRTMQAKARKNGATEASIGKILTDLGHDA